MEDYNRNIEYVDIPLAPKESLSILNYTHYKTVAACGDIHGNFRPLVNAIETRPELHQSLLIVCGDIGMGFNKPGYYAEEFAWMEKRLSKIDTTVIFFRGNHDNPEYFWKNTYPELKKFHHVVLIDDYTLVETQAGNILCIGGAVSIDRSCRIRDVSWWRNEIVNYPDQELYELLDTTTIDIVMTHTTPGICGPQFQNAMGFEQIDSTIMKNLNDERSQMTDLYGRLADTHELKYWMYGHFHNHYTDRLGTTTFIGLDMLRNHCLDFCILPVKTY